MAQKPPVFEPRRIRPRRILRYVLIGLAGIVILLGVAAGVFVATFDANSYKPRIIAAVKQATGRDLALNGPIGLRVSLQPAIEARDVTFANPPGFSRPQMATLERLDLQIALLPLLSRRVEVNRLVLVRPDIQLETDAQGHPNWQMQPEGAAAAQAAAPAAAPQAPAPAAQQTQIALDEVRIKDGRIGYRDGKTGRAMVLAIEKLSVAGSLEKGAHIDGKAAYNAVPLALTAAIGALQAGQPMPLDVTVQAASARFTIKGVVTNPQAFSVAHLDLGAQVPDLHVLSPLAQTDLPAVPLTLAAAIGPAEDGKPLPLDVMLEVAGAKLTAKGAVADTRALSGAKIDVAAQVPDLHALSPLARADLPALKGVTLQATVADLPGGFAKGVALQNLKLTTPAGDLSGGATAASGTPPALTADLSSTRLDADALLASLGKPVAPAGSGGMAAPRPAPKSGRLFSDAPLPFTALKQVNADLRLAIADLRTGGTDYRAINAHAVVKDGRLQLDPFAANLPGGHLDAKAIVDASQAAAPVSLSAHAPGLALAPLLAAFRMPGYASGDLEIYADLRGAGQSQHAIAASLDGFLGLAVAGGRIDSRLIGGVFGNVLDKVNGLVPLSRGGSGELRCFAARLDLRNGVGSFRTLELESSLLKMSGTGSINLGTETLDMQLVPKARAAATDIAVPMRVSGAIMSPRTEVNTVGAATSNAETVAGAVIGNATPLGLVGGLVGADKMLGLSSGDPCPAALAIARGRPVPATATAPPKSKSRQPKESQPAKILQGLFH